jgi:uncharacterized integral membrane protein (TIGR00698 family)
VSGEKNTTGIKYLLTIPQQTRNIIYAVLAVVCLLPFVTPAVALAGGFIAANLMGQPTPKKTSKITKILLQCSVVGLGFGMNLQSAAKAGMQGLGFTVTAIAGILILGYLLGRLLKTDSKTTSLLSSGTAICGGSAIAAVAPIIQANEKQISISLGIVFILNSVALFLFPPLGHSFGLTQDQFGLWSAIAIHDTSSVVGAASRYGARALEVATTVKLARALWIIPLSIAFALLSKKGSGKIKIPWFIGYFIIAMTLNTYFEPIRMASPYIVYAAKAGLKATLFLIGSGLSIYTLREVGFRPLILGLILWIAISVTSLWAVIHLG